MTYDGKAWYRRNREKRLQQVADYYESNREEINRKRRAKYRAEQAERQKLLDEALRDLERLKAAQRRA